MNKTFILVSMPENFSKKYIGFIHNLNMINSDKIIPVTIENIYHSKEETEEVIIAGNDENIPVS